MDYEFIDLPDSALAAAALFLTRIIRGDSVWSPTLQYYSGKYKCQRLLYKWILTFLCLRNVSIMVHGSVFSLSSQIYGICCSLIIESTNKIGIQWEE